MAYIIHKYKQIHLEVVIVQKANMIMDQVANHVIIPVVTAK